MIWLSVLLVFGTVGVIFAHMGAQDGELRFGFQQMIHARIPWLFLLTLWSGCALGIASFVRQRRAYKYPVLGLEIAATALVSWYFLSFSYLPPHELAVQVGDPLPSYELVDHEGGLQRVEVSTPRKPVLYVFYRGDW